MVVSLPPVFPVVLLEAFNMEKLRGMNCLLLQSDTCCVQTFSCETFYSAKVNPEEYVDAECGVLGEFTRLLNN